MARLRLASGSAAEARGTVLAHADMTARHTFDRPDEVKLAPLPVSIQGGSMEVTVPKHAVASVDLRVS